MTANEAPEKIYLDPETAAFTEAFGEKTEDDIEYTRTDAFVEKACKWLKENAYFYVNDYTGSLNDNMLVDEFRKAMKGE